MHPNLVQPTSYLLRRVYVILWNAHGGGRLSNLNLTRTEIHTDPRSRRVWVVQEVAVAQTVTVVCGTQSIPWEYFDVLIDAYVNSLLNRRNLELPLLDCHIRWDAAAAIQMARRRYQGSHSDYGLAALLIRFRGFDSSDPRDKIYGLLQLSQESQAITPDYSKSAVELFKETVRFSIMQSGGLAIFSAIDHSDTSLIRPSWCPNWRSRATANNLPFFSSEFCSAGGSTAVAKFVKNTLTLRGFHIDNISVMHRFPSCYSILDETSRQSLDALVRRREVFDTPYKKESRRQQALGEILDVNSLNYFFQQLDRPHHEAERVYVENYVQRNLEDSPARLWNLMHQIGSTEKPIINAKGRKFFISERGYMGLVPTAASEGDSLVVFLGGRVMFCIRPSKAVFASGHPSFELIGDW